MKKDTFYYLFTFLFLMTGIFWQSCELEDLKDKWKPAYSIPLAYASLKMEDLIPNDEKINQALYTDENGLLHLTYEDRILELKAKDFIELINQNFQDDYEITKDNVDVFETTPVNSEVQIINKPYNYAFNSEQQIEQRIDEIVFKSGTMKISVIPNLISPINLAMDITIAALKNENNEPYVLIVDGVQEVYQEVDLSGYRLDFTNDNSNQNAMEIFYDLRFKKESGDVISESDKINLNVNMEEIEFSFVRGFFGKKEIARNEIVNLDMGKLVSNGELFINPTANFKINSNLGVPIQVLIPKLDAIIENEDNTEVLRIK
ncbi:MAG: hypothetical protein B6I24_04565 [Bacteroidetes bacterium 4572_128]|nr:MAG: hypothetical protein B6I24_04565 [Bacteroidetes bacterium 4572_128]